MRTGFTSIIITTCGDHLEDCLKPCLTSLIPNTNLLKSEIIIVANGCKKETKEYVESLGIYYKLLWYEDLIGYPRALNVGIAEAEGEFIVLLNDDTEISGNNWIEMLMLPFSDPSVGITGPIKAPTHFDANRFFLVNFCVMFRREVFDKVGPFDEIFSPGAGEDTDFCIKAENAGYKLVQVPEEGRLGNDDNKKVMQGQFPIYHKGEATLPFLPGIPYSESQARNGRILMERYGSVAEVLDPIVLLLESAKNVRLHLGSGDIHLEGWINCDLYSEKADIKLDCSKIPLPDNSVQEIYACHLLEHFDFREAFDVLREWKRVLKPKGILRIETPDMLKSCKAFVQSDEQGRINLYSHFFSEPWVPGQIHKFLYTETQLRWTLEEIGFKNVHTIPALRYIGRENICLGIECEKAEEKINLIEEKINFMDKIVWRHPFEGWYVHQKPTELMMLSDFLKGNNIKKVLEIGSANGGTAVYWANMVGADGVVYSVDIVPADKCYKGTEFEKQIIEMLGDSHDQTFKQEIYDKVGKVDMLFIDGDHSYKGVKDDFNSFAHLVRDNGFIVLHDIVDSEYHRVRGCFVATLWNEIRNEYKTFEFIDTRELPKINTPALSMGIGLLIKE